MHQSTPGRTVGQFLCGQSTAAWYYHPSAGRRLITASAPSHPRPGSRRAPWSFRLMLPVSQWITGHPSTRPENLVIFSRQSRTSPGSEVRKRKAGLAPRDSLLVYGDHVVFWWVCWNDLGIAMEENTPVLRGIRAHTGRNNDGMTPST